MKGPRLLLCLSLACLVVVCAGFWANDGGVAGAPPAFATANQITHDGLAKTAVLSDGSVLYVAEQKDGHQVISKLDPNSGKESTIAAPFADVRAMDVSPDHKSLLASPIRAGAKNRELWMISLNKVSARKGGLAADDAAWSPNGEQLVSVKGNDIWITSAKGKDEKKVATVKGRPFNPRFSPDGQRIRFSVIDMETASTALWEVGRDGSNVHELLAGWDKAHAACCGVWTKDGKAYIFQATHSWPPITTLWVLPGSGEGEPKQLTEGPMSFGNPWPADNDKIWALGVKPTAELVKYDAANQSYEKLLAGISATDLDFSPDGQWVSYVGIPDGTLWRSRADGSERLQLTYAPERAALPKWTPDGRQIAYVSIRPGQATQISLIGVGGGKATPVYAENRGQIDVNWSADGQRMMFGYVVGASNLSISLLDVKAHKLTMVAGSEGLFSPRWSPDGRYIAALSRDSTKVMIFDFQTQKWSTWFTEAAGSVSYPTWSAESKYLYFDDMVTGEEAIRRVKVGEDHAEGVFVLPGIDRYLGPYGYWVGQAPDGSWMFVRDRSTQEVYSLNLGVSK